MEILWKNNVVSEASEDRKVAVICSGEGNGGNGCGSVLLISRADLYQTFHKYFGRAVDGVQPLHTDYFLTFACPYCNEETDYLVDGIGPYLPLTDEQKALVSDPAVEVVEWKL